jgi:hypothetical protein
MCPIPPLAPKISTDSPGFKPSVSSSPRSAVIASTGIAPACSIGSLPGTRHTFWALTALYCA